MGLGVRFETEKKVAVDGILMSTSRFSALYRST